MSMRLDQFVSQATGMSRKQAWKYIRKQRIQVDGTIIRTAAHRVAPDSTILLDGEVIQLPGQIYVMLHKPAGVISATEDSSQRTVMDLIDHPHRDALHIVGRLDKDSTGLLLLSNDGQWSHRITSPRHHVPKTYLATLAEPLTEDAARQLRQGISLQGEEQLTKPAQVEVLPDCQARITIHEGKYHQVKRMFAATGNHVKALHRERIGEWVLPANLAAGEWQLL